VFGDFDSEMRFFIIFDTGGLTSDSDDSGEAALENKSSRWQRQFILTIAV